MEAILGGLRRNTDASCNLAAAGEPGAAGAKAGPVATRERVRRQRAKAAAMSASTTAFRPARRRLMADDRMPARPFGVGGCIAAFRGVFDRRQPAEIALRLF
jgi:hypothetical protein